MLPSRSLVVSALPRASPLQVDYSGFSTINTQRFGQKFVGKVANPNDMVLWQKAAARKAKVCALHGACGSGHVGCVDLTWCRGREGSGPQGSGGCAALRGWCGSAQSAAGGRSPGRPPRGGALSRRAVSGIGLAESVGDEKA